ncbi:MAG: hypothetical protein HFJ50_00355 [Clostridia bacterium]|nr:hypothetical protein [Clostridia bacterium]
MNNRNINLSIIGITVLIIIVIIAVGSSFSTTEVSNKYSVFSEKFIQVGFSEEQAQKVSKILYDMKIKEIVSLKLIENDNNSDISSDQYNELYECYCDDGGIDESGAHIYLYFKDKQLVYSCFSNHWRQFYDVNRGVIDYPQNYSN